MSQPRIPPSTGIEPMDRVLGGLLEGDNVVWQVEAIEDYAPLVEPFVARALAEGRRLVYFRFARHAPLVAAGRGAEIHRLDPAVGFESFTARIHEVIEAAGPGAFYVFDCLSDLAADWYSDLMLGNFFMVTCPYLYELETVTYFALLRGAHSAGAVDAIRNTTQLLVDVFRYRGTIHVHPLKVFERHSPTMYLPHAWRDGELRPLTESALLAEALAEVAARRVDPLAGMEVWQRRFLAAQEVAEGVRLGRRPQGDLRTAFLQLLRMMFTRDERMADLAARYLTLEDLFAVRQRMIGTGLVGGKAVGMLVARAILARTDPAWQRRLEPHDSWFIGSDVFYTFLVRCGLWKARREQRSQAGFLDGAEEARRRILEGRFPDFVVRQFVAMLESYGQSPIIVRSSSLLEDSFGNAFTGKYESVFCPNQGAPDERLAAFLDAIRTVYASTMSEAALRYREHRGLLDGDEQMGVLVQRVSGAVHGRWFFPQVAGVGLSYNPYVWNPEIDPNAGMVRLVFGLGTRAVDRADDDYTRVVALNAPALRPERSLDEVTEYAQRRADVIDLERRRFAAVRVDDVVDESPGLPLDLLASPRSRTGHLLTFERLLTQTEFTGAMRSLLKSLRDAYDYPVDVEFTANHLSTGELRINVLQCRPLQIREGGAIPPLPLDLDPAAVLLESRGPVIGPSTSGFVDRVIFVDPDVYAGLPTQDRYEVARVIGRVNRIDLVDGRRILLLGPGRWGTSTVSLGVPTAFSEIQRVAAVCEVMSIGNVIPDVSLGSHFFNDLVEAGMLYLAVHPGRKGYLVDLARLRAAPNRLAELLPDDARVSHILRVIDFPLAGDPRGLLLHADCVEQRVVAWLAPRPAP